MVEKGTFLVLFMVAFLTATPGRADPASDARDARYFSAAFELHRVLNLMAILRNYSAHPEALKTDSDDPQMKEYRRIFDALTEIQVGNCVGDPCKQATRTKNQKALDAVNSLELKPLPEKTTGAAHVFANPSFKSFVHKQATLQLECKRLLNDVLTNSHGTKPAYVAVFTDARTNKMRLEWIPKPPAPADASTRTAAAATVAVAPDLWQQEPGLDKSANDAR
jgi:hypothetical protein